MENIKSKNKLEQNIRECFNMDSSSVFSFDSEDALNNNFASLLPVYMVASLKDISINNNYLLELMDSFLSKIGYPMADCFFNLNKLNISQLLVLKEFLLYVSLNQINLFCQAISQGLYAIEWNIRFKEIINSLTDYFSTSIMLEQEDILEPYLKEKKEDEEGVWYLKELYANKSWMEIAEKAEGDLYFVNDHFWLSSKTTCFLVPAVIFFWSEMYWSSICCEYLFFTSCFNKFDLLTHLQANLVARFLNLRYEVNLLLIDKDNDLKKALDEYWNNFLLLD